MKRREKFARNEQTMTPSTPLFSQESHSRSRLRLRRCATALLSAALFITLAACESQDEEETAELLTLGALSNIFVDNGNGTLTQNTGLIWMRCAQGQVWDSSLNTCGGTGGGTTFGAVSLNYCSVLTGNFADCTDGNAATPTATSGPAFDSCNTLSFAGADNWRLPTRTELSTMGTSLLTRANMLIFFPETPDDKSFWSGSANENESDGSEAYAINFAQNTYAQENILQKDTVHYVRCVR